MEPEPESEFSEPENFSESIILKINMHCTKYTNCLMNLILMNYDNFTNILLWKPMCSKISFLFFVIETEDAAEIVLLSIGRVVSSDWAFISSLAFRQLFFWKFTQIFAI